MQETNLYPEISRAFKAVGAEPCKIPGTPYRMGIPDFAATLHGKAIWLEVKYQRKGKKYEKPTELQADHLRRHQKKGAACAVLDFEEADKRWRLRYYNFVCLTGSRKDLAIILRKWLEIAGILKPKGGDGLGDSSFVKDRDLGTRAVRRCLGAGEHAGELPDGQGAAEPEGVRGAGDQLRLRGGVGPVRRPAVGTGDLGRVRRVGSDHHTA